MLHDTQTVLAASLLTADAEVASAVTAEAASRVRAGKLPAAHRLEIYRHNVTSNLRGALKDIYPVILSVVGDAFFSHAANQFICTHPSHSGDLHQFGGAFGDFLAVYPHAVDLPYLCDVARLEWAWHETFHAGDAMPFDLARLVALPEEAHAGLCFTLHPTVRLVQSSFPILQIWEVNQATFVGAIEVDWNAPAAALLIHRDITDGVGVLIKRISPARYTFLRTLQQRKTLEAATASALEEDVDFDLQGFLVESVQSGVVVDFETAKSRSGLRA